MNTAEMLWNRSVSKITKSRLGWLFAYTPADQQHSLELPTRRACAVVEITGKKGISRLSPMISKVFRVTAKQAVRLLRSWGGIFGQRLSQSLQT
jgi:hypothetical protein